MEALREFLAGQHRPEEQNEAGGGEDGVELVPKDWQLSQFWYDERTARELVEEVVRLVLDQAPPLVPWPASHARRSTPA